MESKSSTKKKSKPKSSLHTENKAENRTEKKAEKRPGKKTAPKVKIAAIKSAPKKPLNKASLKKTSAKKTLEKKLSTDKPAIVSKKKNNQWVDILLNPSKWFSTRGPLPFSMMLMMVVTGMTLIWTGLKTGPRGPAAVIYSPNAELQSLFRTAEGLTLGERVGLWSERLRENPKLLSWLEDASARVHNDNAPYIPEAFDCTTFVETVAALARSEQAYDVADQILAIRYKDGIPSYFNRNHFPEADWIPNNEQSNILEDITTQVARSAQIRTSSVSKVIEKRKWFLNQPDSPVGRMPASSSIIANIPEQVATTLSYIPLSQVKQVLPFLPNGAIINIVHADHPRKPVLISHQGLFVRKGGNTYFRHAKRTHGIKDSDFVSYMNAQNARTWKVVGFNVNALKER
jgi:hypothetical protein